MSRDQQLALNTAVHSPWQRATCENTNGLLRQYLPKSTDLSVYGHGSAGPFLSSIIQLSHFAF